MVRVALAFAIEVPLVFLFTEREVRHKDMLRKEQHGAFNIFRLISQGSLVPLADIFNHKAAIVPLSDEYAIEPICFEGGDESGSDDSDWAAACCEDDECREPDCTGEQLACAWLSQMPCSLHHASDHIAAHHTCA